ncbi:MAG TPA: hypothetical protein VMI31_02505 [Fimbriimonadaceae bacterium]|nr:hypothetical protein [Fimbriimonadaceae bacterium]
MKKVSVFMDVEDPINPLADDAALDLAKLFTEACVRGSFCVTGEKCRTLVARGRNDVLDAFRPHCLGLHTDTHSFHLTTMELLEDVAFDEGCRRAYDTERRGRDAFARAFGREPAFWGGAGNTWGPEISDALKRLGIPAYAYALTELPDGAVHCFNGVFALPQHLSISEIDWADDARAARRSAEVLEKIIDPSSLPDWIGLFVGHPTKLRYAEFWDGPYAKGRTPPGPEYGEPLPEEVYERSKANLRAFLPRLQASAEIVGVDEALALPWQLRRPTTEDTAYFEKHTSHNLRSATGWPIHHPGLTADLIVAKTMALRETVEIATLPLPHK